MVGPTKREGWLDELIKILASTHQSASLLHFELEVRKSQQPVTTRPSACLRTAMAAPPSTFVVCFEWQS
ncbi:hypothetical protein COLO4_25123 [Corchorus olitorius]|uniref:Uncharacterized protein n=1 Tax=Corchorus olitorius TaxID=93759 RepID=A0A1R3I4K4_9ROSI|nr:hypothetical protein COLO4_25123 [Corchorus olitorius]